MTTHLSGAGRLDSLRGAGVSIRLDTLSRELLDCIERKVAAG